MRPKTKFQKLVDDISWNIPQMLSAAQKKYALNKCFDHWGYIKPVTLLGKFRVVHCMDCGATFKIKHSTALTAKCPECKSILQLAETNKWTDRQESYFCIIDTFRGYQLIRFFLLKKDSNIRYEASIQKMRFRKFGLIQKGKMVARSLSIFMGRGWILYKPMEVRAYHYPLIYDELYPKINVIPNLRRNGFTGNFHGIHPVKLFTKLLSDNKIETLFKCDQYELVKYFIPHGSIEHWTQVKLCIRNNYIVIDPSIWFDHIKTLSDLGKDILNAHYICPDDLRGAHQHYTAKLREIEKKKELEEQMKSIEFAQKKYTKQKQRYFGFKISDGLIDVISLDHVRDFYEEGEILEHCVFVNKYYDKPDSLILSARKGIERLETIEVDLKTFTIIQSRGLSNESSEYHDAIINLVNRNMHIIKKLKRAKLADLEKIKEAA